MKGRIGAIILALVMIVGVICAIISVERVPAGYEAVVYKMSGGVSGETLTQGWHLVAPTKKVKLFTISNEQLILTKDEREGSEENDSFKVSTSDDASIAISFQMTYRFIPDKLADTYKKFRGMDGEDIVENRVRTVLKSKVSEVTTDYSMMDIYSGNRSEINNKITAYLNKAFKKSYGIEVLDASIIDVHPDSQLKKAITNRVAALQKKEQALAVKETVKVEAETAIIKAENDAKVKITKAQAEAKANKIRQSTLNKNLLTQQMIEKWNGELPKVSDSSSSLFDLDSLIK